MDVKIVDDPNSPTSDLIKNLKNISNQRKQYAMYDENVPLFKSDPSEKVVEEFFTFKKFMFDKILVILIIGLLAIFIMKAMDYM